jgi:hypothetical protein
MFRSDTRKPHERKELARGTFRGATSLHNTLQPMHQRYRKMDNSMRSMSRYARLESCHPVRHVLLLPFCRGARRDAAVPTFNTILGPLASNPRRPVRDLPTGIVDQRLLFGAEISISLAGAHHSERQLHAWFEIHLSDFPYLIRHPQGYLEYRSFDPSRQHVAKAHLRGYSPEGLLDSLRAGMEFTRTSNAQQQDAYNHLGLHDPSQNTSMCT